MPALSNKNLRRGPIARLFYHLNNKSRMGQAGEFLVRGVPGLAEKREPAAQKNNSLKLPDETGNQGLHQLRIFIGNGLRKPADYFSEKPLEFDFVRRVKHPIPIYISGRICLWSGKAALSDGPASFRHSGLLPLVPKTTLPLHLDSDGAWSSVAHSAVLSSAVIGRAL